MTSKSTQIRSIAAPALPAAPSAYSVAYFNQLLGIVRQFFNIVANAINADIANESRAATIVVPSNNTLDLSKLTNFNVNVPQLTDNISAITFPKTFNDGDSLTIRFQQATSTGPFAVVGWPANVLLANGAYTLTTNAAQYDLLTFYYKIDINSWLEQSRSQNL